MQDEIKDKDEAAERRTYWAEDRTLMASERTFASWTGAALGCVGVAIGLQAVFRPAEPTWLPKIIALAFLLVALIFQWSARNRACATRDRLSENDVETGGSRSYTLIALLVTLAILGTGGTLWLI